MEQTPLSPGQNATSQAAAVASDCLLNAEALIYDYQRRRLEATYCDFSQYSDLHDYFFGLLYPPPDRRARFTPRNRAYSRIVNSRFMRFIVLPDTVRVMNQVTELDNMTDALNRGFARELCSRGPLPDCIGEETYFDLCRKTSTPAQHERQFDISYECFYFGELVIKYVKMNLEDMIRLIPRAVIRNSDLIDLAAQTYYTFRRHRTMLASFRLALHERELSYIGRIFGITIDKKPFVHPDDKG
ncbi:MAG: hypothetical protein WCX65_07865 [bacterium]